MHSGVGRKRKMQGAGRTHGWRFSLTARGARWHS